MNITHDEVRNVEQKIRRSPKDKIHSSRELRRILARGLAEFENILGTLSNEDRETALSLYLEKLREVTFVYHMATLRFSARIDALRNMNQDALRARLQRHAKDIQNLTLLYQLP